MTSKIIKICNYLLTSKILYYEKDKNTLSHFKEYHPELLESKNILELKNSRGLFKNLSGLIYLTDFFNTIYPDAKFIGIVRNPLAVCEGHLRRGAKLEEIAVNYENACQQMINHEKNFANFAIYKFEDIIEKPYESLNHIYNFANLEITKVTKIKLQIKKVVDGQGAHILDRNKLFKQIIQYDISKFENHFHKNVNQNQINRLSKDQKELILKSCYNSMKHFNYL